MQEFRKTENARDEQLSRLVLLYEKDMLKLCFVYLRDMELARDALQESYLKAYRSLDSYQGSASEKTWLTRIVINTCKDFRRTFWFRRVRWNQLPEWAASRGPDVSEEAIAVSVEIARLPAKLKEAVLLYSSDIVASIIPDVKRLRAFEKVCLERICFFL